MVLLSDMADMPYFNHKNVGQINSQMEQISTKIFLSAKQQQQNNKKTVQTLDYLGTL